MVHPFSICFRRRAATGLLGWGWGGHALPGSGELSSGGSKVLACGEIPATALGPARARATRAFVVVGSGPVLSAAYVS